MLVKMGRTGPLAEPRRGPQAGKSADPRSKNADNNKGRPAWLFQNAAAIMRLRPGLNHNFTVMGHAHFCQQIFQLDVNHDGWAERSARLRRLARSSRGPCLGCRRGWSR